MSYPTVFQRAARRPHLGLAAALAATACLAALAAPAFAAADAGLSRTVNGMTIYLGVIASEIASEHPLTHPEAQMHGGKRPSKRSQHVVVAVYDTRTNGRVIDATVKATVIDPGINEEEKALEPMTIAGTLSYGNYFSMKPRARYVITVVVLRPGMHQATRAQFDYALQ